ncbi:MAG: hypothetical protein M3P97_00905 [Actinomycetota bacterium]|nr:hypothetical protein [Actinomycetota bacterium]
MKDRFARAAPPAGPGADLHHRGVPFWAGAVAGWAVIAWALVGVARHAVDTRPAQLARFLAGGILVHDLVVVPLALLAAVAVARSVPNRWRPYVQAALVVIAGLSVFAFPLVRGYGRIPSNPTALPHDYRANLAMAIAAVALLTAVLGVARSGRRRFRERRLGR